MGVSRLPLGFQLRANRNKSLIPSDGGGQESSNPTDAPATFRTEAPTLIQVIDHGLEPFTPPPPSNAHPTKMTNSPATTPTNEPPAASSFEYDSLSPLLDSPELLLDALTPQGRAFEIIKAERISNQLKLIQRFSLMCLYYSTEGSNWWFEEGSDTFSLDGYGTFSKGWHLLSPNECSWHGIDCTTQDTGHTTVTSIKLGESGWSPCQ